MAADTSLRTMLGVAEPGKGKRLVIWDTEEITVGRAADNDIVLDDTDASRNHLRLVRKYEGFEVHDLKTANGTTLNGEKVDEPCILSNKDTLRIGEFELTFIQSRKDPAGTGLPVEYASQLKEFAGGPMANADPEATTLGLADAATGSFEVEGVGGFQVTPGYETPAVPRDLDSELGDFGPGAPVADGNPSSLSLRIELKGLTPDLRQQLTALMGKVIELPALKIRISDDDF